MKTFEFNNILKILEPLDGIHEGRLWNARGKAEITDKLISYFRGLELQNSISPREKLEKYGLDERIKLGDKIFDLGIDQQKEFEPVIKFRTNEDNTPVILTVKINDKERKFEIGVATEEGISW